MKIKRIARIKDLSSNTASRLSRAFENEGYETELVATYLTSVGEEYCKYDLNIYTKNKKKAHWYA